MGACWIILALGLGQIIANYFYMKRMAKRIDIEGVRAKPGILRLWGHLNLYLLATVLTSTWAYYVIKNFIVEPNLFAGLLILSSPVLFLIGFALRVIGEEKVIGRKSCASKTISVSFSLKRRIKRRASQGYIYGTVQMPKWIKRMNRFANYLGSTLILLILGYYFVKFAFIEENTVGVILVVITPMVFVSGFFVREVMGKRALGFGIMFLAAWLAIGGIGILGELTTI